MCVSLLSAGSCLSPRANMVEQSGQEWAERQCVAHSVQGVVQDAQDVPSGPEPRPEPPVPHGVPTQQQPWQQTDPARQYSNPNKTKANKTPHARDAKPAASPVQHAVHAPPAPPAPPSSASPKNDAKDSFVFAVPNRKPPVMVDWVMTTHPFPFGNLANQLAFVL